MHNGVVVGCCGVLVDLFGGLRGVVGVIVFVGLILGLVVEGVVVEWLSVESCAHLIWLSCCIGVLRFS